MTNQTCNAEEKAEEQVCLLKGATWGLEVSFMLNGYLPLQVT